MVDFMTISVATSPVLGYGWIGEAASARRTVPPVCTVKGTGLPFAALGTVGAVGVAMGTDQLQGTGVDRSRIGVVPGIPPRWGPVRC